MPIGPIAASRRSGASLPAMSPLQPRALDEVAKRWRLEHSHSVSAIHKSGLRVLFLGYEKISVSLE